MPVRLACKNAVVRCYNLRFYGGCSSVGRVPDCDSGCRGFEPHQSPQNLKALGRNMMLSPRAFLLSRRAVSIGQYQFAHYAALAHHLKRFQQIRHRHAVLNRWFDGASQ